MNSRPSDPKSDALDQTALNPELFLYYSTKKFFGKEFNQILTKILKSLIKKSPRKRAEIFLTNLY